MSEQTDVITGYPRATRILHWVTVLVLAAQFAVGYAMDLDDGADRAEDRLEQRADDAATEAEEERLEEQADRVHDQARDDSAVTVEPVLSGEQPLLTLHVVLGLTVMALALVRLLRRRVVPLPPWAEGLTEAERRLAHRTEQTLYLTLVVMPASGIGLVLVSGDLLGLHVASHVVFFAALAAHVGLVLKHQFLDRDQLLRRML